MEDWMEVILERERQCHLAFFGQEFDFTKFQQTLGKCSKENIECWQRLGLEPHFLPPVAMSEDADFTGWKIKPEGWYYRLVAEGMVLRQQADDVLVPDKEAFGLEGISVLIDTRLKPQYKDGEQMFENDNLLGPVMERLRSEGKIDRYVYGPQSSRFGVRPKRWEWHVKPTLAEFLGLSDSQIRLERVIEQNVIPQMFPHMPRKSDGDTDTWCWYEEYFAYFPCRGCITAAHGGLWLVHCGSINLLSPVYKEFLHLAIRPLVVL